jgi:hypothetical protein
MGIMSNTRVDRVVRGITELATWRDPTLGDPARLAKDLVPQIEREVEAMYPNPTPWTMNPVVLAIAEALGAPDGELRVAWPAGIEPPPCLLPLLAAELEEATRETRRPRR